MVWLLPPLGLRHEAALRDVASKRADYRARAAQALGEATDDERAAAIVALMPLSTDPSAEVRASALASLGRLRAEEARDLLLTCFEDADPTVRQVAMVAAADLEDPACLPAFVQALAAEPPEVRFQAVAVVAEQAPPGAALAALAPLVDDPDPEVRSHLAEALGEIDDAGTEPLLGRLVEDRARPVRFAAAVGLARRGDDRGEKTLRAALEDRDRCFHAAWALGELGRVSERTREALARIAGAFLKPLAVKAAASAALLRVGDDRGVAGLRAVLGAMRGDARAYAVELVGELRETALLEDLLRLVDRPRGVAPEVLATALERFADADPRAREALLRLRPQSP
jgi:HEAT repeat protein